MEKAIVFEGVGFAYPGGNWVFRDLNLEIDKGSKVLVVGPSGGGKTTFLNCVNGLVPNFCGGRFAGHVKVFGQDTRATKTRDLASFVGMVFQDPENQSVMERVENEIVFGMENLKLSKDKITK